MFVSSFLLASTIVAKFVPGTAITCGTSKCDLDMVSTAAQYTNGAGAATPLPAEYPIFAGHVLTKRVTAASQAVTAAGVTSTITYTQTNQAASSLVNSGKSVMNTRYVKGTTINNANIFVKYGGFCAQTQKTAHFIRPAAANVFPPAGVVLPEPSWIPKLRANGHVSTSSLPLDAFVPGTYKLDITNRDAQTMNAAASACLQHCRNEQAQGCKYGHYGYEDGLWFCKLYRGTVCTSKADIAWEPAIPSIAVSTDVNGNPTNPEVLKWGGGCRVTDQIATTTAPIAGMRISPNTPFLAAPVIFDPSTVTAANLNSVYASIACSSDDLIGFDAGMMETQGLRLLGLATYGTVWL